ncbi:hypothetical protein [Nostoc sp. GT001]|uniref:hypothetical protein n=1 Tax=Nostoc sp. GT001 TaxID=3056647 RepID=UPI0025AAE669|nr:hypothetical protein [Nostoc sp. GT001]MDM9583672.1 hypothetical protein [Nostoc sp. GT001]
MSNIDGFTSNNLLQQMYGTQFIDEDVDLKLSDEELELIANQQLAKCDHDKDKACSKDSDVIVGGNQIISLDTVLQYENDHPGLIRLINERFKNADIPITQRASEVLSNNLRHEAPRVTKRVHRGFKVKLTEPYDGQLCFFDESCPIEF